VAKRRGRSVLLAVILLCAMVAGARGGRQKHLIEMGWDEPDPAFMRQHVAELEATPFDGVVYNITYAKQGGGTGRFTWEVWGRHAFTEADLAPALADLEATPFRRFQYNFLRFNVTPADLDWFDDFGAVVSNARLAASVARRGGSKGIAFDSEHYMGDLFDYPKQRDAATRSWEAYAAQARRRGREVMEAFQAGYPDLTVFLLCGYSLPYAQTADDHKPLRDCTYGLYAPFLDGMVDAARGGTRLVDGYELSYGERDTARFAAHYRRMKHDALAVVADPAKYRRVFSFGFGIRIDQRNPKWLGWYPDSLKGNYFAPEAFGRVVRKALETADDYVWIYGEAPRWWTPEGRPKDLPEVYDRALRAARGR